MITVILSRFVAFKKNKKTKISFHLLMSLVTLILLETNAVSMVKLHSLYKTGVDNVNARVYRSKLKDRIKSEFGNRLLLLTINSTTPQVVVSSEGINSNTIPKNKEEIIKECAKQLSRELLQYPSNYCMPWSLTTETIAE